MAPIVWKLCLVTLFVLRTFAWDGHTYYNDRFGSDGINYDTDDSKHCLFSDVDVYGRYDYQGNGPMYTGCSYDQTTNTVTSCTGSSVILANAGFVNITAGTFAPSVTSIIIESCSGFQLFEDRTFENLTRLTYLRVYKTALNHFPDLSNTIVENIYLVDNAIKMDTATHRGWDMPTTIKRICLANNAIYWVPPKMFSGPDLRVVSVSNNQLPQIHPNIFGDVSSLVYFGVDGNLITRISRNSLAPLATNTFLHLNVSNNILDYIQPQTFRQLPAIRILEVHGNQLKTITWDVFSDMPYLAYISLNQNNLTALPSKSFVNLPSLKELRLHSQKISSGLKSIAYDAWSNIDDSLRELFVSDNNLATFPHQVLEEGYYPNLVTIHADNNNISNITEYGTEAFPSSQYFLHAAKKRTVIAFKAYPALTVLYLHSNRIEFVNTTDLCPMQALERLYLDSNQIKDTTLDVDAFACLPKLNFLELSSNYIQYVPDALKTSAVVPALEELVLTNNNITFLEADAFSGVNTLITLHLPINRIVTIENGAFPLQISYIDLSNNEFRFLHEFPFSTLAQLTTLDLSANAIQYLPDRVFENTTSLRNLYLNSNNIPQLLVTHFQSCPLTGTVNLESNDIGWIEDGTFSHISTMANLILSDNKLTKVPLGTFADLTVTNTLTLANNRINVVPSYGFHNLYAQRFSIQSNNIVEVLPFGFSGLQTYSLSFGGNSLRTLHSYAFNDITVSTSLDLSSMYLTSIPERALNDVQASTITFINNDIFTYDAYAFYDVTATSMYLSSNSLATLPQPLFGGTSQVSNFFLDGNDLLEMSVNSLDNVTMSRIYLQNNQLTYYPEVLNMQNFILINLNDNNISRVPASFLAGMTQLTDLYLERNLLTTLEDNTFLDTTSLRRLALSSNQLASLPSDLFDSLSGLQQLYLSGNQLKHFYSLGNKPSLSTVNLATNQIETFDEATFSGLPSLSSLSLTSNPMACSCQLIETLVEVESAITGGVCASPAALSGLSFTKGSASYIADVDPTNLLCGGDNVTVTGIQATNFTVEWDQPVNLHYIFNITVTPASVEGEVTYDVLCTSPSATSLTDSVTDTNATVGPQHFSVLFDVNDGVVAGATYTCTVTMATVNSTSGKSYPAIFVTANQQATSIVEPGMVELEIYHYDFSKDHPDFTRMKYISVSDPTYVASPYGPWLAVSNMPTSDTFSDWFRLDTAGNINYQYQSTIILQPQTGTIKKFWSDSYYPVDAQGYGAQSQKDCDGIQHNFGFTSVVKTGIEFQGTEVITLGGGDGLWFYINKVRLVEYVTSETSGLICYRVDLSPAASIGGGIIYPQAGTLVNGVCTGLVTPSTGVSLELEVGVTYHFDIFLAETIGCSSEFLLQTSDVVFKQDRLMALPVDYTIYLDEDTDSTGFVITTVTLSDVFSQGTYSVTLYAGGSSGKFGLQPTTYTYTAPAITEPVLTNKTDVDGNLVSYLECSPSTGGPATFNSDPVSIATSSMFLTLVHDLDYESTKLYNLLVQVVDIGLPLTGYIGIRVLVQDVNDNCPVMTPTSVTLTPLPVLVFDPLVTFNVTDSDSGENSNIRFIISEITEDPPVNYNDTMELWDDVYLNYTTLIFEVIAIDNGTTPRGIASQINITLSNTCVMDVLFGKISYYFVINDTTGEMFLRIPGYWVQSFACTDALGFTKGFVLDSMLSASSSFDDLRTGPGRARVNHSENVVSELVGAWVAGVVDTDQYVELDMGSPYRFTQSFIQGRADADEWVTTYQLQYYDDDTSSWVIYVTANGTMTLSGNSDRSSVVKHDLDPVILSQKVRINPRTWHGANISMRLEFSGCSQAEQLYYDVSCMRCETTYYCEGDGVQKMCGRCDDTTATCDRNPIEHSFGATSECSECPKGWICENGYATPCEANHYVECTNTSCPVSCSPCEPGYACLDGIRTLCGPGTYSDGTMEFCESCQTGFYQDASGQSSCKSCPAGHYSNKRMTQCDICSPEEYSTDTSGCIACSSLSECPCLSGSFCHDNSLCYNTGSGTAACKSCPSGMTGDGLTCTDTDECTLHDPCFQSRCINTAPGYQCLECPDGYTGTYEDAYSWNVHRRVFVYMNLARSNYTYQTCDDIDECQTNHGGCDPLMPCVNTQGSYYCDFCASGYMGTNKTGCYPDNFCFSGAHDCTAGADCIYLGPAQFRCVCKPGYAGNGELCGLDSDNDGFPDVGLSCLDWGCSRDNCGSVSNSMQEDTDSDNMGDNCDRDDDNDGRYDSQDNCQFVRNWDQSDTDGDGVGDACDNCPNVVNTDQLDTDEDGTGNDCDADDDGDGVLDVSDNCPLVANPGQENSDGDSHGDACDNCPALTNENQADNNQNLYGDACDTQGGVYVDEDGDSVPDSLDNCPSYMNADQSDIDADGTGDACDADIDGDSVANSADNCPYLVNPDQTDVDGNGVGDLCESDTDGDGSEDKNDTCPHNPAIQATSFKTFFTVNLDPSLSTTSSPNWVVKNNGGEVIQTESTSMPSMLIGKQSYGALEYKGTWFVSMAGASDYVGCVFGYVSNRKFYIVMWRGHHGNYNLKAGINGVQIKVVDSTTGPGSTLTEALWHSWNTASQVRMLWQDTTLAGWQTETSYRWHLTHQPTTGYINLKIYQGPTLISDSGSLYDVTITGGRVGVFQHGAFPVTWSYLVADCLTPSNKGLYLDGVDDYVQLDDLQALNMSYSFTIETWLSLDTGYTSGPYPVFCSVDGTVCLLIDGARVVGRYGNTTVTSTTSLTGGIWYNIIMRHQMEDQTLTLFINAVSDAVVNNVPMVNITDLSLSSNLTVFIGREDVNYFKGTVDEVRFYSEALLDSEIVAHLAYLERPVLKSYGTLHFRMEDSTDATNLINSGVLSSPLATRTGGTFVQSFQQADLYKIVHPSP